MQLATKDTSINYRFLRPRVQMLNQQAWHARLRDMICFIVSMRTCICINQHVIFNSLQRISIKHKVTQSQLKINTLINEEVFSPVWK